MTKQEAIELLKPLVEAADYLQITLETDRKSVSESCDHYGTWNEHDFTCTSTTYWRSAEVEVETDAEELYNLLVEKDLGDLTDVDFDGKYLGEANDGDTEVSNIEWEGEEPSEEEKEENDYSDMELYWSSDIGDCEVEFDSVLAIRFEIDGVKYTIEDDEEGDDEDEDEDDE
jgi:hypothetical protein